MTNQLATTQGAPRPSALRTMAGRLNVEPESLLSTLKATVCKGCSDAEVMAFSIVSNEYGLNPFIKQIYAFPAKGGGIVPVVSIDGWIAMANNHPQMDGIEFEDTHDENGNLVAIACTIYRKDRTRPIRVQEYLDECKRPTDPWKMPHRMLRHKALIQTARVAFGFSGLHDDDEADDIARNGGMRDVTPKAEQEAPKVVTGGAGATTAGKQRTKAPAAEAAVEAAAVDEAPAAAKMPPRGDMVNAIRVAFRAAGKTLALAEEHARHCGIVPTGKGFAALSDEEMFTVFEQLALLFPALPVEEETQTEGGAEA